MRRIFIFICLSVMVTLPSQAKTQGRALHDLLLSYMQVEDVHPDSLESNIADLKQKRLQSADPAERAIYAAAIGRLYGKRMLWRSVGTDLRDSCIFWYGRALADKQVLAQTKAKQWKPFVVIGKDEGYFGGDMLNVVWRSMVESIVKAVRDTSRILPKYDEMVDFYRQQGLRNGALLLAIDSLYDKDEEVTEAQLLKLRDEYADLPLCAEIYLRLGTEGDKSEFKRREWLQQGIQTYPKYKRKSVLQNALTRLSDPTFHWEGPTWTYPGKTYKWVFTARNVQSVVIDGIAHEFAPRDPIETFRDSIMWTAPHSGDYTIVFEPKTRAKVRPKIEPMKQHIRVSALQLVYQLLPDDRVRMLVVDSETGQPQPDVTIMAYQPDSKDSIVYFTGRTNAYGKLLVPRWKDDGKNNRWRSQLRIRMSTPTETDLPIQSIYLYYNAKWVGAPKDSTRHINVFTDRAIYRPGQTVHVSGLAYNQLDWESSVIPGEKHVLVLYDSNHKEVEKKETFADEMGVFSSDFVLPEGRKNGTFLIEVDKHQYVYFRVEEYKRPTFEVTLDDSLYVVGDSVMIRGTARNYEGSPLRGARVTGTYRWQTPWLYGMRKRFLPDESLQLDTIETDDKGGFEYKLRMKNEELRTKSEDEDLRINALWRYSLFASVDVLSQQGETHNAQHYWHSPMRKPEPKPEPVRVDSTFLVRCVADTFSLERAGRIEVTTVLKDVYLHYTLSAAGKIWKDEMVKISDETFALDIPYREEYDQSLTASFCFVKNGKVYTDSKVIRLAQPDNKLRAHWDTFRDLLQPGQKEEWRLSLRRPDGTPADASLMVAMYDASLDYFVGHQWNFAVGRHHRTYGVPYQMPGSDYVPNVVSGWYAQKLKKERDISLSHINPELFETRVYTRAGGHGPIMYKAMAKNEMMLAAAPAASMKESMDTDDALEGRIAGLDVVTNSAAMDSKQAVRVRGASMDEAEATEEEAGIEAEVIAMPMRENFNETAFFYPQLRTDKQGQVSIAFTLPESLTRWNFIGMAHTQDMMYANLSEQIEARKDLMAQLYLPRFLRPGDEAVLTAMVRNVCEQSQQGKGVMQILDAKTEKVLKQWKADIRLAAKKDTVLHFPYSLPLMEEQEGALIVRWAVEGTTCSDGEQRLLPVLPATQHVTNTVAITAYDPSVQHIDLSAIFPEGATNRKLTVEYTTHPEQYALQALPALAKAKRGDVLSVAAAYYSGVLGKVLDVKMADSTEVYLQKLMDLQDGDGGFRWYPEMMTSPYLTREVSYLLTRLYMMTGKKYAEQVNTKALHYLLGQRIDSTYLSTADLRTLYIAQYSGAKLTKAEQKKVDFLMKLAKREDVEEDGYERQALLTIVLKQGGADRKARKCAKQFRKYLVTSPERGTYIEFPKGSFTSIDRKLHIHVQLMEALQRMNPEDTLLRGMRRHLLQQKRTQEWTTPINSANAIFALLGSGAQEPHNLTTSRPHNLKTSQPHNLTTLQPHNPAKDALTLTRQHSKQVNFVAEDDTLGYVRDSLLIDDGKLPVRLRLQKVTKGESWGGVYADFEQDFDKVEARSTGLSVRQEYPTEAKTGSRYTVRYYISADRDYEYVTLIVPRPAFTEPVNQRSGYGWSGRSTIGRSGGLGYYRQVHDATTEYSFCQIPRGDYLIEETLYVERDGRYHSGIAVIRCEYADEFQGHSDDKIVQVKSEK